MASVAESHNDKKSRWWFSNVLVFGRRGTTGVT